MLLAGRGVAQLGSAPGWGPGGRRFKSGHPDHLFLIAKWDHIFYSDVLNTSDDMSLRYPRQVFTKQSSGLLGT